MISRERHCLIPSEYEVQDNQGCRRNGQSSRKRDQPKNSGWSRLSQRTVYDGDVLYSLVELDEDADDDELLFIFKEMMLLMNYPYQSQLSKYNDIAFESNAFTQRSAVQPSQTVTFIQVFYRAAQTSRTGKVTSPLIIMNSSPNRE